MSTKENIQAQMLMPQFTIDNVYDPSGKLVSIGIKRMFDIALALNDSIMIWSGPGVGKSQGVMQWNNEKVAEYNERIASGEQIKPWNPHVCDVRLSMKEPVDMVGVPIPTKNDKGEMTTVWATPSMWPKDDGEYSGGVIFLDEMNQGQAAILNAAFQLVQDRQLGEYKVPKGYIIIAASNPSAFNSSVTEFSLPLSNRFSHFNIRVDFDGWLNYRLLNGGNVDVMAFLKTQSPALLFDEKGMEDKVGDLSDTMYTDIVITPRSWEVVEKVLSLPDGDKETGGFTIEEKKKYATGRLGSAVTNRLFNFIKDKNKYQSWEEILVEKKPFRDEDSEQFWYTQMSCIQAISGCNDDAKCRDYVLNFIEATRQLKHPLYKTVNISTLVRLPRLKHQLQIFGPVRDAPDLLALISDNIK